MQKIVACLLFSIVLSLPCFAARTIVSEALNFDTDSLQYIHFLSLIHQASPNIGFTSQTDPDCYDFGNNYGKSSFYIELLGGPDFVSRSLQAKSAENEPYVLVRNDTESQKLSWMTGIRISGVTQKNIAFRGALFLSRINEEFSTPAIETVINTDPNTGLMDTVINATTITSANHLRTLDIHFTVGYEMDFDKWTASVNVGGMMNMAFSQQGSFISPTGELVSFSSDDPTSFSTFKNNAGFGILSHVDVAYKLTKKIHAVAEVNFRYRLGSLTRTDYPLEQSYTQIGVLGGIRYVFN